MPNNYCFRKFITTDYSGNTESSRMGHTFSCMHERPKARAWEELYKNNWFDIKLYWDVPLSEYTEVLDNLIVLTNNNLQRKHHTFHFSNHGGENVFNKQVQKHFWEIIKYVDDGKVSADKKIYLQVQNKIAEHEPYNVATEFFDEIVEYCKASDDFELEVLATLSTDLNETCYYGSYK